MWSSALADPSPSGGLVVKVEGLPPGQRPLLSVVGPDRHRTLARADTLTLPNATPGAYTIRLRRHRITKRYRTIRRGALAFPAHRVIHVTVQPGATAKVAAPYGTIINPNVS